MTEPHCPIVSFGIVSAGRPKLAARAFASFAEHGRGNVPARQVLVHDGAPEELAEYRLALRELGIGDVTLVSLDDRRELAHELVRATGISQELLEWALVGSSVQVSTGSARNALQLLCVDHILFVVDDDILCLPPDATLALSSLRPAVPGESTIVRLGEDVPSTSGAPKPLLEVLLGHLDESGRIAPNGRRAGIVQPRVTGQCVYDTPFWNLFAARSDREYAAFRLSRRLSMVRHESVVFRDHPFMSYATLYDGYSMLPPWPAQGRSSDAGFAVALGALHGGDVHVLSEVAVEHRTSRPDAFPEEAFWLASGPPCGGAILAAALREVRARLLPTAPRLESSTLADLGEGLKAYADDHGAALARVAADLLRAREVACRRIIDRASPTSLRRLYAERSVARIVEAIDQAAVFPPRDYAGRSLAFVEEVRRYAELLIAWPAVCQGARELRSRFAEPGRRDGRHG